MEPNTGTITASMPTNFTSRKTKHSTLATPTRALNLIWQKSTFLSELCKEKNKSGDIFTTAKEYETKQKQEDKKKKKCGRQKQKMRRMKKKNLKGRGVANTSEAVRLRWKTIMPTRPPYCNLGTGRTRPLTSVICVSTLMSNVLR